MRGVAGVSRGGAAAAGGRVGTRPASGGFSVGGGTGAGAAAAAATAETGAASATTAVAGLSLLAAQEENGGRGTGRDAAARRRAASILDELRGLQAELLGGRPDPGRLARLAALQDGEDGSDPGLREAVRAVALRARVELARLRSRQASPDRSAAVP